MGKYNTWVCLIKLRRKLTSSRHEPPISVVVRGYLNFKYVSPKTLTAYLTPVTGTVISACACCVTLPTDVQFGYLIVPPTEEGERSFCFITLTLLPIEETVDDLTPETTTCLVSWNIVGFGEVVITATELLFMTRSMDLVRIPFSRVFSVIEYCTVNCCHCFLLDSSLW